MSKPLTREAALAAWPKMLAAQGRTAGLERAGGEHESDFTYTGSAYRSLARASGVPFDDVVTAALEDRLGPIAKLAEQRGPQRKAPALSLTSEQVRERMRRSNPQHARALEQQRVLFEHLDRVQQLGPQSPVRPVPVPHSARLFGAAAVVEILTRRTDPWMGGDAA